MDTEPHIIVTHDVTNKGFDRDQLSPMAMAAKDALGRDTLHALADKGCYSGVEIVACDKAGLTVTMCRNTVAHPFGTIKAWMGATCFLMRRLKNVRTEMALNMLAYNTKRMVSWSGSSG